MSLRIILFASLSALLFSACQKAPSAKADQGAQSEKDVNPPVPSPAAVVTKQLKCTFTTTESRKDADGNAAEYKYVQTIESVTQRSNVQQMSETKKSYNVTGSYRSQTTETDSNGKQTTAKSSYNLVSQRESETVKQAENIYQLSFKSESTLTATDGYLFKTSAGSAATKKTSANFVEISFDDGHSSYVKSHSEKGVADENIPDEVTTYSTSSDEKTLTEHTVLNKPWTDPAGTVLLSSVTDCTTVTLDEPADLKLGAPTPVP